VIIGTGIDIVDVPRMQRALRNPLFVRRVFTGEEQVYCKGRGAQLSQSFAARYAAKEAVMKAFGVGIFQGPFTDIEVVRLASGRPQLRLSGWFARRAAELGITATHISLSHTREYAAASCILEGKA
jgi:holo-[acyl-carrier protein] synthase